MMNQLDRLKSLRAEIKAMQCRLETLKAIACSSKNTLLDELITDDETKLADLQSELATLTHEVTNAICAVLTEPLTREVVLAREVESAKLEVVARRIKRSSRWVMKLHKRGLKLLTAAAR